MSRYIDPARSPINARQVSKLAQTEDPNRQEYGGYVLVRHINMWRIEGDQEKLPEELKGSFIPNSRLKLQIDNFNNKKNFPNS